MMIQKIFHMNQSVVETQRRLKNVGSYRHHLEGVDEAQLDASGASRWKLQLPLGFHADFVLEELVGAEPDVILFRSVGGNVDIMGSISFQAVKAGLTEVELLVNYESASPFFNLLDRMLSIGDHFVANQLRRVRAHFEGIAAPAAARPVSFFDRSLASA